MSLFSIQVLLFFVASQVPVVCPQCGDTNIVQSGSIKTPNYPGLYPESTCSWVVRTDADCVIKLKFLDFVLEAFDCKYDNVTISYIGGNRSKFCSTSLNKVTVYVPSTSAVISLRTDPEYFKRGFYIEVSSSCPPDVDPCTMDTQNCPDNYGKCKAYICSCQTSGYSWDGAACTDLDECSKNKDNCHENATCTNTDGSFTCACKPGFDGDGTVCRIVYDIEVKHQLSSKFSSHILQDGNTTSCTELHPHPIPKQITMKIDIVDWPEQPTFYLRVHHDALHAEYTSWLGIFVTLSGLLPTYLSPAPSGVTRLRQCTLEGSNSTSTTFACSCDQPCSVVVHFYFDILNSVRICEIEPLGRL